MRRPLALYALALGLLAARAQSEPAMITLSAPSGRTFEAEVMLKPEDRAMGLMFRPTLAPTRVLLFVFDESDFHGIWMKNCRFPIDIVWLDEQRQVVHVAARTPPCKSEPCPVYAPPARARYVVEMNANQAARVGAKSGARFEFTLPR